MRPSNSFISQSPKDVEFHYFDGSHPTGNVGTHIHCVDPLHKGELVWFIEAADVVIMTDHLSKIPEAVNVAKRTRNIVLQNIVFALAVKGLFVALGGFGLANMWEAVFADMGVALIAILNATRVLRIK